MSNNNEHKRDTTKGGLIDGITDLTNAAKETVKQAENASQTPADHISELAAAARETVEAAKKQQHDTRRKPGIKSVSTKDSRRTRLTQLLPTRSSRQPT